MSRHSSASHFHKSKILNEKYRLGEEIGKGAYGRVYRGYDLETGDFLAIKQVSLENMPLEDLASIMQEIDLLKNLNHEHIVKYTGSFSTKSDLYILLEYVEIGSLANHIKQFNALPESRVADYIRQILEGLVYLHEQGVIHRDIKGANILITKKSCVKLADFGVATKLTEADVNTHSVVGTPYWMAPEVIEMSGVSAASDIWSVGCTVIELLTCVPPYYDLQPMPALFRIVQDDHPPLPENVSTALTDFLQQCFRKDAKLRPDARTLLKHPWIRNNMPSPKRQGRKVSNIPQDVSTVLDRATEDGEKEDRRPASEDASTRDPSESGSDDEQKTASSSQNFETSAPSSSQSNSIGRRARIRIPRGVSSMQRMAMSNGSGQLSPSSVMNQFAPNAVDRLISNSNPAVDGPSSSLRSSSNFLGSPDLPGLSDRFQRIVDMVTPVSDEGESFDNREIKIGRGGFQLSQEVNFSSSTYQQEELQEVNSTVEAYGLKQKASRPLKSQPNGSHHPPQHFESNEEGRDYLGKQAMEITRLVSLLKPDESEDAVISACLKLVAIFQECPEQKAHLISQHGILPLVEMLDVNNNRVLHSVLHLLNQIIRDNGDIQENACLVGLIPMIMNFAAAERSREMRMQAAIFVHQICLTSRLTLRMFIACRGLPVLVSFLEPDYTKYREMVHAAIDAMWQVFELQKTTARNDFCRIFAKSGELVRLVNTLYSLNEATRVASGMGVGISSSCTLLSTSSAPGQVLLRTRSGPLEHSRTTNVESFKPRSGQLDPARVRTGYMEPHRQVTGLIESSRPKSPQPHKAAGLPEHLRHLPAQLDQGRGSMVSAEPARMGTNLEGGYAIPWQSPARSLQFSVDKDLAGGHVDSPRSDAEQSRILLGSTEIYRAPVIDQSWHTSRIANGLIEPGHHDVQPLLSLLEKEPPSRPGQTGYYRHVPSSSFERHDSSLPLLHHASAIRKVNGKLDVPGTVYTGVQSPSMVSPSPSAHNSLHGLGSSSNHSDAAPSSSKTMSLRDSGHLSTAKLGGGLSPVISSRMVSTFDPEVTRDYVAKVADLLLEFSRADTVVKSHMCSVSLLIRLFQMLSRLEPVILLKSKIIFPFIFFVDPLVVDLGFEASTYSTVILKCIKELSTDPFTLEFLQRADAMKHLIPFLELREGPYVSQIHNQVLNALYNLCKINKRRQEQAAESGIIPHLMYFIKENSPLKQFALPLLCDMAHASRYTREQLRAHKGLEVYLTLLNDEYWAVTALDSLAVCLAHDNDQRKVEQALLKKDALQKLVAFFRTCTGPSFVQILEPFLKIITKSVRLNTELAVSGLTPLLVGRLDHQDAIARLNLLKLIKAVYEHHPRPKQLIVEHDLPLKLRKLIEERRDGERSGGQVLVKQMATALLKALHINTVL